MLKDPDKPWDKMTLSFFYGMEVMAITAVPINALNTFSLAGSLYHVKGMLPAAEFVYKGRFPGALGSNMKPNTVRNYLAGMSAHLSKETVRGSYKGIGLGVLNPMLQSALPPHHAELAFAGTMSVLEMAIANPFDFRRVCRQANENHPWTFKAMYAGAGLNGMRQFGTWWGFSYSTRLLDGEIKKFGMDPNTYWALAGKAPFQSLFFTSLVYGLEALKNQVQREHARGGFMSFRQVCQAALKTALHVGPASLFPGMAPKIAGNAILAFGAALVPKWVREHSMSPSPTPNGR